MAATIDPTVAGPSANSFTTLAEFKTYLATRLFVPSAVEDAEDDMKNRALISATRALSGECWTGSPATTTQALPWPRSGMLDRNGNAIAINVIPLALKDMENELAFLMMQRDRTISETDASVAGLKSLKAGSIALTFTDSAPVTTVVTDTVRSLGVPSWFCETGEEAMDEPFFQVI